MTFANPPYDARKFLANKIAEAKPYPELNEYLRQQQRQARVTKAYDAAVAAERQEMAAKIETTMQKGSSMLGNFVRDRLTGFKGLVVSVVEYADGRKAALIQPRVKSDGSFVDPQWIAIARLDEIGAEG